MSFINIILYMYCNKIGAGCSIPASFQEPLTDQQDVEVAVFLRQFIFHVNNKKEKGKNNLYLFWIWYELIIIKSMVTRILLLFKA